MRPERFDVIVIGGGVNGAAAAFQFARERKRVLVLERSKIPLSLGQSFHGRSKQASVAYDSARHIRFSLQSLAELSYLEHASRQKLFFRTGGIDIAEDDGGFSDLIKIREAMTAVGMDFEEWDHSAVCERIPVWKLPENARVLYSPNDGIIDPKTTLMAYWRQIVSRGGKIKDEEEVENILADGGGVQVMTHKGVYQGKNLIIACGAWTNALLDRLNFSLPIKLTLEQNVYYEPAAQSYADFAAGFFPTWFHHIKPAVYGFPIFDEPGVKLGFHHGGPEVDMKKIGLPPRRSVTDQLLTSYLEKYLPIVWGLPFGEESCVYDTTPDKNPYVGFVPGHPNVMVIAGSSGSGFNKAPGIGRAVKDLIISGRTEMEISDFKIDRFINQSA